MPKNLYQEQELAFLRANSAIMPIEQIAEHLGRTPLAIKNKIYKMRLPVYDCDKRKVWTDKLVDELKKCYATEPNKSIAEKLKLTMPSIRGKAGVLGLIKDKYNRWKIKEITQLKNFIEQGDTVAEIAEKLGRKPNVVYYQIYQLGLTVSQIKANRAKQPKKFIQLD